jgi:hypothetical protein
MYIVEKTGEKCGREERRNEKKKKKEKIQRQCELKRSVMVSGDRDE